MQGYIVSTINPENNQPDRYHTPAGLSENIENSTLFQDVREARLQMANVQTQYTDVDVRVFPVIVTYQIVDRLPPVIIPPEQRAPEQQPAQPTPAA